MLTQVQLLYLIFKVNKHKLKLIQELVIHILRLAVADDNDALIWIIKNMLEDGLSFDNIIDVVL